MIPVADAETLLAEAKALRAEVREVVAIPENWNADRHRNHADPSWPQGEGDNASGTMQAGHRPQHAPRHLEP